MNRQYVSIAMAYVGVLVGAGLSSGQDILQYFLSFGEKGLAGILLLGVLNVVFGRIIITLGCHFQSGSHQEVLEQIAHPVINKIIDVTLICSCFVVGFVMVAGAGANLHQQFGLPSWLGALLCSLLVVVIAFLDFDKITRVLGIFTPIIVALILLVTGYTFFNHSYDFAALNDVALTLKPALPNVWLSVINYYALCAMNGVSMAFVLGGSVLRIGEAEKVGLLGGTIIGVIIASAALTLFAHIDTVKDAEIPMLLIVNGIHPWLALGYAVVIFALIFNTAFSLYYATAKRLAGDDVPKMRRWLIGLVALGYVCSFGGFTTLVSYMYPLLGYMGMLLLAVLAYAWWQERENIFMEKLLRRKMIRLLFRKYDDSAEFTEKHKKAFNKLGELSAADTEAIKEEVRTFAKEVAENNDELLPLADEHLPVDNEELKRLVKEKEEEAKEKGHE